MRDRGNQSRLPYRQLNLGQSANVTPWLYKKVAPGEIVFFDIPLSKQTQQTARSSSGETRAAFFFPGSAASARDSRKQICTFLKHLRMRKTRSQSWVYQKGQLAPPPTHQPHPQISPNQKYRLFPAGRGSLFRLFWCQSLRFGNIGHGSPCLFSNIMEQDCTCFAVLDSPKQYVDRT